MFLFINKGGANIPVYAGLGDNDKYLGYIATNEVYAAIDRTTYAYVVGFYTGGQFIQGYVRDSNTRTGSYTHAFSSNYAYGSGTYTEYGGQESVRGYRFNVAHKCRVFSGTREVLSLYSGDFVIVEGYSHNGSQHPYRLAIVGYSKDGRVVIQKNDMWCDTDIEIGWNQPHKTAVIGKW